MTGKERALLRSQAHHLEPVVKNGKESLTPEVTQSIAEALEARELIKVGVLKNCLEDPRQMADILSERLRAEPVQVIGRKFVLYKKTDDEKYKAKSIVLPRG